jgi:hypothetical protein
MLQAKLATLWVQDNRLKDFNGRYAHNLVPKLEECGGCHFCSSLLGKSPNLPMILSWSQAPQSE